MNLSSVSHLVARLLGLAIQLYRYAISPMFGPRCRFHPSCSAYALEALQLHGLRRGSWLAVSRLARCHPWGGSGIDPVPGGDHTCSTSGSHGVAQ